MGMGIKFRELNRLVFYPYRIKLISQSALIRPSRFITIAGLMLAIYGLGLLEGFCFLVSTNVECSELFNPQDAPFKVVLIYFIGSLVLSSYISFFFARRNTEDFTQLLSNNVRTDKLIRFLALEILLITRSINRTKRPWMIRWKISRNRRALRTVDSLKGVLAERLMLSHRELSDDFLKFNATVYINRQIYRAELIDSHILKKEHDETYDEEDENILERAKALQETLQEVEEYLSAMAFTNMDLKRIEYMFQTRSIAIVTQYFIGILDTNRRNLFKGPYNNFDLLFNMMRSHRTGVAIYRSIGMTILIYLDDMRPDFHTKNDKICRPKLFSRIGAAIGENIRPPALGHLKDWSLEATKLNNLQREQLAERVAWALAKKIQKIKKTNEEKGIDDGRFFIVVASYSRLVRYIFDKVAGEPKIFRGIFNEINIVILVNSEVDNSFEARLMFHHITKECMNDNSELSFRTWRSTASALMSHFDCSKDSMVVLSSADRIGHENATREDRKPLPDDKRYHCHNDISYLNFSISAIDLLRPKVEVKDLLLSKDEVKREKVDVLVVGGSYKYDLKILIDQFDDSALASKLRTPKRKRRRSGLYEWKSNDQFNVKVITVPLEVFPESYSKRLQLEDGDESLFS